MMTSERSTPGRRRMRGLLVLAVVLGLLGAAGPARSHAAPLAAPDGRDTGLVLPTGFGKVCYDATQPGVLLMSISLASSLGPAGSYALETEANRATRFSDRQFALCSETTGLLFTTDGTTNAPIRFSRSDPAGRPIAHNPTYLAADDTAIAYSFDAGNTGVLWASTDGGLTW